MKKVLKDGDRKLENEKIIELLGSKVKIHIMIDRIPKMKKVNQFLYKGTKVSK